MKEIYRITEKTFSGIKKFYPEVMMYEHLYDEETTWNTLSLDGEDTFENAIGVIRKNANFFETEIRTHGLKIN